ncbi:MAG: lactate racemase domain-containing protein, partial [bacterium]|nr:lactate racemase domain-containing protein [bacterium]
MGILKPTTNNQQPTTAPAGRICGAGYTDRFLTENEVTDIAARALDGAGLEGKKLLLVIPDHTRSGPIDLMFKALYGLLADKTAAFDILVALGTHPPMPMEQIYHRVGITADEHREKYPKARFFNHLWKDPAALITVGTIPAEKIEEISNGLFKMPVNIAVNKMVMDYDHLMIVGPVFPHEVVGFSGGNKYIFPGIAGQEIIDFFHWLGALITNPMIIGKKYTPVRAVVDLAVSYVPVERSAFCLVVKGDDAAGLYYGTPEEAWSAAADLSDKLHITYMDKPYHTVLSCAPAMYDDLWTGGKCMYKLEPVVADGGRLIIYAPHITEISYTHGKVLDEIGYHTRDYFTAQWERFKEYPWGVVAHSTHVRGTGTY